MPLDLRVLRKLRPRKHRPQTPEKLRPLGVSKIQTPRKTQTPGCLENSDPPKNSDPWVSRKISRQTPPKHSDPWVSRKLRPPEKLKPPEKLRPLGVSKTQTLRKI